MGCAQAVDAEDWVEAPEPLVTFFADDLSVIRSGKELTLEDLYITNRINPMNHFYVDDSGILWASGHNTYGQLGNGKADALNVVYEEPIKVAENVVSVDCSRNGYFCIYLTNKGELYGMGSNMLGLLGQDFTTDISGVMYSVEQYEKVPKPVLLMENVSYARAGRESIVALKTDGSVWWWGQYRSTYSTNKCDDSSIWYWKSTEDEHNPLKMLYNHPTKLLENCIFATTGTYTGAAITEDGDLYTWGLNIFGECGTDCGGDDYLRKPTKVLENVRMVWPERIFFDNTENEISKVYDGTDYSFNVFVQLQDGTILAAGEGLGTQSKTLEITGDLEEESSYNYSCTFVPVNIINYSEIEVRKILNQIKWGMNIYQAQQLLQEKGITSSIVTNFETLLCLVVQNSDYIMYFDEEAGLCEVFLQNGGSRDDRFHMGMTTKEVTEVAKQAGYELQYLGNIDDSLDVCYEGYVGDTYYIFFFSCNDELLYQISEYKEMPATSN